MTEKRLICWFSFFWFWIGMHLSKLWDYMIGHCTEVYVWDTFVLPNLILKYKAQGLTVWKLDNAFSIPVIIFLKELINLRIRNNSTIQYQFTITTEFKAFMNLWDATPGRWVLGFLGSGFRWIQIQLGWCGLKGICFWWAWPLPCPLSILYSTPS